MLLKSTSAFVCERTLMNVHTCEDVETQGSTYFASLLKLSKRGFLNVPQIKTISTFTFELFVTLKKRQDSFRTSCFFLLKYQEMLTLDHNVWNAHSSFDVFVCSGIVSLYKCILNFQQIYLLKKGFLSTKEILNVTILQKIIFIWHPKQCMCPQSCNKGLYIFFCSRLIVKTFFLCTSMLLQFIQTYFSIYFLSLYSLSCSLFPSPR